jgi:uncharacterized YigZ family protein
MPMFTGAGPLSYIARMAGDQQTERVDQAGRERPADAFRTLERGSETEIKILGSRFLSYARPVPDTAAFTEFLEALKKQHHAATHHCWAWRVGTDYADSRFNDDGEPAGTAGRRILASIDHLDLTFTAVIVVRYFGGTKLGVGGLARAYTDAADAVLALCPAVLQHRTLTLLLCFPYDMTRQVHHAIERHGAEVLSREYRDDTAYVVSLRASLVPTFEQDVLDLTQRTATVTRVAVDT